MQDGFPQRDKKQFAQKVVPTSELVHYQMAQEGDVGGVKNDRAGINAPDVLSLAEEQDTFVAADRKLGAPRDGPVRVQVDQVGRRTYVVLTSLENQPRAI